MHRLAVAVIAILLGACSGGLAPTSTSTLASSTDAAISPSVGPTSKPTPTPIGCPAAVDLASVSKLDIAGRLACFGDRTLTLEGIIGCGGCGGAQGMIVSPDWLAGMHFDFLIETSGSDPPRLAMYFPPGLTAPAEGSILRVMGHFNDSRATECTIAEPGTDGGTPIPIPKAEALQFCRERFVVESFEITGVGPPPLG